jgi:hypothetical protein
MYFPLNRYLNNYCEKLVYLIIHFKIKNITKMAKSNKVIGTPIKIGKLEVAQNDFPNPFNWDDANKACAELGDGWRLPTKNELNFMNKNKDKIGGFTEDFYWSSTEYGTVGAWSQNFFGSYQGDSEKEFPLCVRSVKSLPK